MKIVKLIKPYALKHRGDISIFFIINVVLLALSMFIPYTIGNYIDSLIMSPDLKIIWRAVIILGTIWTLQLVLTYVRNMSSTRAGSLISFDLQYGLIEHLKSLPVHYFSDKDSAYINQRVSSDAGAITNFIMGSITSLIITSLSFLFAIAIMFTLNVHVTLMICSTFPLYILIYHRFKRPLYESGYKLSEESNMFHGKINKQLGNIKLIKQNAWSSHLGVELETGYASLFKTIMRNANISYVFNNADSVVRYLVNIIIFIYSGYQIIRGNLSVGEFTMINSYSAMAISALSVFLGFGKSYRSALVAYDRIVDIYSVEKERNGTVCINSVESISVHDLNFSYGERHIIKNFNTVMEKGNIYVVTGENGSGKSTFLDVLTGIIQNYSGRIFFDSHELRELDILHLREKCLSVIEQEPTLFFNTLKDNISFNSNNEDMVGYWLKKLDLTALVSSLPGNIDYNISEKTSNLSGGEKQRIAEVRAFVKDTDVLIMDEPDSALDRWSLRLLCEILRELKKVKLL